MPNSNSEVQQDQVTNCLKELFPTRPSSKQLDNANRRFGAGKATHTDVHVLNRHLTILATQEVAHRLLSASARISISDAVSVLQLAELEPSYITIIGDKFQSNGIINSDELKQWQEHSQKPRESSTKSSHSEKLEKIIKDTPPSDLSSAIVKNLGKEQIDDLITALDSDISLSPSLEKLGYLDPNQKQLLLVELRSAKQEAQSAQTLSERLNSALAQSERIENELRLTTADLESRIANGSKNIADLQIELAEARIALTREQEKTLQAYESRTELLAQIARLQERLPLDKNSETIIDSDKDAAEKKQKKRTEPALPKSQDTLKEKWTAFANVLFGSVVTSEPLSKEMQATMPFSLEEDDRLESQAHMGKSTSESARYGVLAGMLKYSAGTIFASGENLEHMDNFLVEMNTEERRSLALVVEHLVRYPKIIQELYPILAIAVTCGVAKKSSLSDRVITQGKWVTRIGSFFPNDEERELTQSVFLDLEGLGQSLKSLSAQVTDITANTDTSLKKHNTAIKNFSTSEYLKELLKISNSFTKLDSKKEWTSQNRLVDTGKDSETLKSLKNLDKLSKKERDQFENTLRFLSLAVDLAYLQRSVPKDARPKTYTFEPQGDKVLLKNARNLNSIAISLLHAGANPAYLPQVLMASDARRVNESPLNWPFPTKLEPVLKSIESAISHEKPISLELDPKRPIIVLAGHNGSGKTHSMETLLQTLGVAEVTHIINFADLKSPRMSRLRGLIGASTHSDRLSTFQNESTHLRNVFESLSKVKPGERAVLAIDEVGKGTDSRDALAIMGAAAEYCRRRGIFLILATHHSREFLKVADTIGLRPYLQILSPDPVTHQLVEYQDSVSSDGIEVLRDRPLMQQIPPTTLSAFVANAMAIRSAVLNDTSPTLVEVPVPEATIGDQDISFLDSSSADDMGYSSENSGSLAPIVKELWVARSGKMLEKQAKELFLGGLLDQMSQQYPDHALPLRHSIIHSLHQIITEGDSPHNRLLQQANAVSLLSATFYFDPIAEASLGGDQNPEELKAKIGRLLERDSPLASGGLYYDSKVTTMIRSWNYYHRVLDRSETKELALELSATLSEVAPDLSLKIKNLVTLEGDFVREHQGSSLTLRATELRTAIEKSVIGEISYGLRHYLNQKDLTDIATELGISPPIDSKDTWVKEQLLAPIRKGESNVLKVVRNHVKRNLKDETRRDDHSNLYDLDTRLHAERSITRIAIEQLKSSNKFEEFCNHMKERGLDLPSDLRFAEEKLSEIVELPDSTILIDVFDYMSSRGVDMPYGNFGFDQIAYNANIFATLSQVQELVAWNTARQSYVNPELMELARVDQYQLMNSRFGDPKLDVQNRLRDAARLGAGDAIDKTLPVEEQKSRVQRYQVMQRAWDHAGGNPGKTADYSRAATIQVAADLGFYIGAAHAHQKIGMVAPTYSADGSLDIVGGIPLGLLTQMSQTSIIPQDISMSATEQVCAIGGANGNGKSQLLQTITGILLWARQTGKVPAQSAVLPERIPFIMSQINAGETTQTQSSWQNEGDRYANLLARYIKAGSPRDGYLFFDEPGAGTSPEDQIGTLQSLIAFFAQRNVKVFFSNHNHLMYDMLQKIVIPSTGKRLAWKPVAYLHDDDPRKRYAPKVFSPERTRAIRSDGIKVAAQFGVLPEIISLAEFIRKVTEGDFDAELQTTLSADQLLGLFKFGNSDDIKDLPAEIVIPVSTQMRLLTELATELKAIIGTTVDLDPDNLLAIISSSGEDTSLHIRRLSAANLLSSLTQHLTTLAEQEPSINETLSLLQIQLEIINRLRSEEK